MTTAVDRRYMMLALSLGRRGMGQVWPNPAVGCVIVGDGVIVGRGVTATGGRPHAETEALAQAGDAARGATAYVTLEPCAHHGKTPPCAQALIDSGIARVVIALGDPDTRVAGKGIAMLHAAGITVETGLCADIAAQDHAGFLRNRTKGRPWLTLKLATTLDGRIGTVTGDSRWITGPDARRAVHAMRMRHDAVMVGGGTARADDPMLDVRDMGAFRQPVRVIVSRAAHVPTNGRLARTAAEQPVWLVHGPDADTAAWERLGATSIPVAANDTIDLTAMMQALGAAGLTRVFCEGGGSLAASLLSAGLVDELVMFGGGVAVGDDGQAALGALGVRRLAAAPRFTLQSVTAVGGDILHRWRPV